jgi:putative endonuclease
MSRNFAVYILTTRRRTALYIGVTSNLPLRLAQHRSGLGSRFVRRYSVTRLVHVEWFSDPLTAITREKQLKAGSRADKLALIERDNPGWVDLA